MRHAKTLAVEAKGRRGTEIVMMEPRPTPPMPVVIMSRDKYDKTHTDKRLCNGKDTRFYYGMVAPFQRGH